MGRRATTMASAADSWRRRRRASGLRIFAPLRAHEWRLFSPPARERHVRRAVIRCPSECDARWPRTWDAGLRLRRALRAHGAVEGARQLCESLHRYARARARPPTDRSPWRVAHRWRGRSARRSPAGAPEHRPRPGSPAAPCQRMRADRRSWRYGEWCGFMARQEAVEGWPFED